MTAAPETRADPPLVLREDAGGIATLTLNRPDKFNALSSDMLGALQEALDALMHDRSVRVVVLAGAGRAFCAGHDLKEMRDNPDRGFIQGLFEQCAAVMLTLTRLPQPVIARVHGIATAAGCQLVAQCDMAVATESARFATSGINVGLFCSTPMVAVTRNLPRKQAMEMLMTGDFIDAPTAHRYGLVNRVVSEADLAAAAEALAATIAAKSPASVAFGKRLFYRQLEDGMAAAYDLAAETMTCNMETADARDGIAAFVEKKPMPDWKGE